MNKIIISCVLATTILVGCSDKVKELQAQVAQLKEAKAQLEKANEILTKSKVELEDKLKLAKSTIKEREEEIKKLRDQEENKGYLKEMFGTKR